MSASEHDSQPHGAESHERQASRFGYCLAVEGKRGVELRCGSSVNNANDVGSDPQPVGIEVGVANPLLQIGKSGRKLGSRRDDRLGRRNMP